MATEEVSSSTVESLTRIQSFDVDSVRRKEDLGRLNFEEVVPTVRRIVETFQRIPPESIRLFPDGQANQIKTQADGAYQLLTKFVEFDPTTDGAAETRRSLIAQAQALPEQISSAQWNHISFSVATSLDPTATQQQFRASLQQFDDEKSKSVAEIAKVKSEVEEILQRVRDAAAEQGVSQQASYFSAIADKHDEDAKNWMERSLIFGIVTVIVILLSSITYKIPWIAPDGPLEAAQLISSKLFLLGILGYGLFACVKNFLSHKHNAVVNRHRQNALLTYTAFVDAAPSSASREVVLTHAAASVFAPQETGYVKQDDPAGGRSVMEMVTRATMGEARAGAG